MQNHQQEYWRGGDCYYVGDIISDNIVYHWHFNFKTIFSPFGILFEMHLSSEERQSTNWLITNCYRSCQYCQSLHVCRGLLYLACMYGQWHGQCETKRLSRLAHVTNWRSAMQQDAFLCTYQYCIHVASWAKLGHNPLCYHTPQPAISSDQLLSTITIYSVCTKEKSMIIYMLCTGKIQW